jgi:hypothetical protein
VSFGGLLSLAVDAVGTSVELPWDAGIGCLEVSEEGNFSVEFGFPAFFFGFAALPPRDL